MRATARYTATPSGLPLLPLRRVIQKDCRAEIGAAMTATKILWGQILVVFAIVLTTTWGATQWTAWRLGFQPQLGTPWFEVAGMPVYPPPAFFWWWYFYDAYAPRIFFEGALIAVVGRLRLDRGRHRHVGLARPRSQGSDDLWLGALGDADEVRAAGLLGPDGVVLGRLAARLSAPRRTGARAVLRADPVAARASASWSRRC